MAWATNSIEIATQRQLALLLRERLPEDVAIERSLIAAPPEAKRVTVLPGEAPGSVEDLYIGRGSRAHRQHEFTVRTWTEVIGDDQDQVEDDALMIESAIEDVLAEGEMLTSVDGLAMFSQNAAPRMFPVRQVEAGFYFVLIDRDISATGRYD